MKKVVILVAALLWLFCPEISGQTSVIVTKVHGDEYTVTTADGLELHAWLTPSPHEEAPLYVLLPMLGLTHTSYSPLIKAFYGRLKPSDSVKVLQVMPHFLSLDLRGHGKSTSAGEKTVSYKSMEAEDFAHYPADVHAMIEHVLKDQSIKMDRSKIAVVGASIGANTAVMVTEEMKGVSRVAMLSPGESYRSLEPASAMAGFEGRILVMAGDQDAYAKTSSEKLVQHCQDRCTLRIYDGPYHGTDLLDADIETMEFLIDWLVK